MVKQNFNNDQETIYIYTLGKFLILHGDNIVSESSSRSRRMWEVFKFMLSNRGKSLFPEFILSSIWPEEDYIDPAAVMRGLMFRLKHALNVDENNKSLSDNLAYTHGSYHWDEKVKCWIDYDEFESLVKQAHALSSNQPDRAIELYQKAVDLYKGEYLPESSFSDWVVPLRSYYHNMYLESVFTVIDLLKHKQAYNEIISICEKAVNIDYYEEKIHIILIEALLAEGLNTRAKVHYNEVTSAYYRDMGIKPSHALKNIYRLINHENGNFELDLSIIKQSLRNKEASKGAYLCDADFFRYIYNLELEKSERSKKPVYLTLLAVTGPDNKLPSPVYLKTVMGRLEEICLNSLRKGDLVTRWNEAQLLMLLPDLTKEQAVKVLNRIESRYLSKYPLKGIKLHKKVTPLQHLDSDIDIF